MPARRVLLSIAAACGLVGCGRLAFDSASTGDDGGAGDDASAPATTCTDGDRRTLFDNHCYFSFNLVRSSADAATICADAGAHLATIAGAGEQAAVLSVYGGGVNQWIGLGDAATEGTFAWTDGTPLSFMNWAANEPNNGLGTENCVEMASNGLWNDRTCDEDIHFACERDPVKNVLPCTEGDQRLIANGHCYSEWNHRVTYTEAVTACSAFGAHLATIADADEDNAVLATMTDVAWIGLTDRATEGTFAWDDGEPLGYTRWADGEPNDSGGGEDCTEMRSDDSWNDVDCGALDRYICERDNVPTTCTFGDARVELDGRCYWRVDTPVNWDAARLACDSQVAGATLASIVDAETNRALYALHAHNFWIGGTDASSEGTFTWANGDAFGFTQWAPNEPNGGSAENCVELTDPGWNDAMCTSETISFTCERK